MRVVEFLLVAVLIACAVQAAVHKGVLAPITWQQVTVINVEFTALLGVSVVCLVHLMGTLTRPLLLCLSVLVGFFMVAFSGFLFSVVAWGPEERSKEITRRVLTSLDRILLL